MANIGIVDGIIRLKDEFTSTINKASDSLAQSGERMKRLGSDISSVGSSLTTSLTVPIAGLGAAATKLATDFESSFAGVRKTVDATEPEFEALAQSFRDLSKEIPINVNELNALGEAAGQLGIKKEFIVDFTSVVANLGVSTNLTAEQAATSFARIANITGLPQSEFENLGSAVVALGNNFATTEEEIVNLSLRMAGAGEIAGLTEPEILAIGAAMTSVGVQAEAGGTAVQKVLIRMTQAASQGGEDLRIFADAAGMSADQFASAFKDNAGAAFTQFVEGLGKKGDDAFAVLEELDLQDQRLIRSFVSLAGAGDLLARAIDLSSSAFTENTALAKEAEERYKTFGSQLTLFWNRLKDVGITIGQALIPIFNRALETITPWIAKLDTLANMFAELPAPIQTLIVAMGAIAAAVGPVLVVAGTLVAAWGAVAAFIPTLVSGIGALVGIITGPVGWIAAGAALLLAWKPVREFIVDFSSRIIGAVIGAVGSLISILRSWWDSTETLRNFLFELSRVILDDVIEVLSDLFRKGEEIRQKFLAVVVVVVETSNAFKIVKLAVTAWIEQLERSITVLSNAKISIDEWKDKISAVASVLSVVNPALGASVLKMLDWTEQASRAAAGAGIFTVAARDISGSVDNSTVSIEDMDRAFKDLNKSVTDTSDGTDDIIVSFDTVGDSADSLTGSMDGVINMVTEVGDSFSESTSEIDLNRKANDLLRDTYQATELSSSDLLRMQRELSSAVTEGTITFDQFRDAMSNLGNTTSETGSTYNDVVNSMILESDSLANAMDNVFGRDFTDTFTSNFQKAADSGKSSMQSIGSAWKDTAKSMGETNTAIVNGIAAASGEMQDLMTGAMSAISAFAQGNMAGGVVAAVGTIIGAFRSLFGGGKSFTEKLEEAFATFNEGGDVFQSVSKITLLLQQINETRFGDIRTAAELLEESFEDIVDAATELGPAGALALGQLVTVINEIGIASGVVSEQLREKMGEAYDVLADRNEFLLDQSRSMVEALTDLITEGGRVSLREIEFAAEGVAQAFFLMVQAGLPITQIIDEIGSLFGDIQNLGVEMGAELGEEFTRLGEVFAILSDDKLQRVIGRLENMQSAAEAAGATGLLTAGQFDAFGDRIRNTFNQMVMGGLSGEEALASLQGPLQLLQDLSEQYGFELDDNTQKLLDQAKAQGLVAEKGLTSEDILIRGFDRMLEALNRVIVALGGIPVQFETWGDIAEDTTDRIGQGLGKIGRGLDELGDEGRRTFRDLNRQANEFNNNMNQAGSNIGNAGSGGVGGGGQNSFQGGTDGFTDFGLGEPAMLHGIEQVITVPQAASVAAMVEAAIIRASQSGDDSEVVDVLLSQTRLQEQSLEELAKMRMNFMSMSDRLAAVEARRNTFAVR